MATKSFGSGVGVVVAVVELCGGTVVVDVAAPASMPDDLVDVACEGTGEGPAAGGASLPSAVQAVARRKANRR
jgi:hypothetical protein